MTQQAANEPEAQGAEVQAFKEHHDFAEGHAGRDRQVLQAMAGALKARAQGAASSASGGAAGAAKDGKPAVASATAVRRLTLRRPWVGILAASAASLVLGAAVGTWMLSGSVRDETLKAGTALDARKTAMQDATAKIRTHVPDPAENPLPTPPALPAPAHPLPGVDPLGPAHAPGASVPGENIKDLTQAYREPDAGKKSVAGAAEGNLSMGGYAAVGALGVGGSGNAGAYEGGGRKKQPDSQAASDEALRGQGQPGVREKPLPVTTPMQLPARVQTEILDRNETPNIHSAGDLDSGIEDRANLYMKERPTSTPPANPAPDSRSTAMVAPPAAAPAGPVDTATPSVPMPIRPPMSQQEILDAKAHKKASSSTAQASADTTQAEARPQGLFESTKNLQPPTGAQVPTQPTVVARPPVPVSPSTTPPVVQPAPVAGPVKPDGDKANSQTLTWKRSGLVPNTARLMVGDNAELPLTGMQANIHVDGFRARVLVDLYFYNDRAQQLQGNFNLRLPDGAAPYYFAFGETSFRAVDGRNIKEPVLFAQDQAMKISYRPDRIVAERQESWLQPKEARMVPREKAAQAYRDTVYNRRIDPALLEWSGAGVFAAHVFPLQAQKLHRIVIGYDVDLTRKDGNLTYRFDLPGSVPMVAVDLSVATLRDEAGGHLTVTPAAKPFGVNNYAYFRYDNPQAEAIAVTLDPVWAATAAQKNTGAMLLTGTEAQADGGGSYFAAQFVPPLPTYGKGGVRSPDGVFLLDLSFSTTPEKFNTYRNLLGAILRANRVAEGDTKSGGLRRFKVVLFNAGARYWRAEWMDNTADNVAGLLAQVDQLVLEGASDLAGALQLAGFDDESLYAVNNANDGPDFYLLSDGAATWGPSDITLPAAVTGVQGTRQRSRNSLFAYLVGNQGNDRVALDQLARQTGGAVFTINSDDEVPAVAVAHRAQAWELGNVSIAGVSDLMVVGNPKSLYPGQALTVVGRGCPAEGAEFRLAVRLGNQEESVTVPVAHRLVSELAARTYGQAAVDRLERTLEGEEAFATAYACHFRITGKTCSLLMLESEADYARYNIRPEKFNFDVQSTPISSLTARHAVSAGGTGGSNGAWSYGKNAWEFPARPAVAAGSLQRNFTAWVERLKTMPGMRFQPTQAFMTALSAMPERSFYVAPEALLNAFHSHSQVPEGYETLLRRRAPSAAELMPEVLRRRRALDPSGALVAASTRVELSPGDAPTLREAAYVALDLGFRGHAYHLLRRVAEQRPFEADVYLTMAQLLAENGNGDLALAYYEIALGAQFDGRFGQYAEVVQLAYLDFLDRVACGQYAVSVPDYAAARRAGLLEAAPRQPQDLVTIVQWNTDGTDVDLHVTEANGEDCSYQHTSTRSGGRITRDVTTGFGPEMYTLTSAPAGEYKVWVHFFAQDRTRLNGATSAYVTVIRKFGSAKPEIFHRVVLLENNREAHDLAVVSFK